MSEFSCILAITVLSTVSAAPSPQIKPDEVLMIELKSNFNGIDPWQWSYKTSDGQSREESGALTPDGKSVKLQGSYKWTSPEGTTVTVTFTADDHGFVPKVTRETAGWPLRVQEPVLNGGQAEPRTSSTTEQPEQSQGPSTHGAILGGFVPTVTQETAGGSLIFQEPPLDGGQEEPEESSTTQHPEQSLGPSSHSTILGISDATLTTETARRPPTVQGPPLDGDQAETQANSTTQQPEQSQGPSLLGAILGGLLLGSLIG